MIFKVKLTNYIHFLHISGVGAAFISNNRVEVGGAANTTAEGEGRDSRVRVSGRMRYTQWAVNSFAILQFTFPLVSIVMFFAEVCSAEAFIKSFTTAEHALPGDGFISMLSADHLPSAIHLQLTRLAQ